MISNLVYDTKQYITELLKDMKSKGYLYHNLDHTLDVWDRARYLSKKEGVNYELSEMLQLAALFHDTGFLDCYEDNEGYGADRFEKFIIGYDKEFPIDKLDIIKNTILSTSITAKPDNLLQMIIKDADMDNIGRDDFVICGINYKRELERFLAEKRTDDQWLMDTLIFFKEYKFFTQTQNSERKAFLNKNLIELETKLMNFVTLG